MNKNTLLIAEYEQQLRSNPQDIDIRWKLVQARYEIVTAGNRLLLGRLDMPRIYTDRGIFIPSHGDTTLITRPGQQISIFNFGCTQLSAQGLQYPIRPFNSWWQGTLNEATADRCIITADGTFLIYVAY